LYAAIELRRRKSVKGAQMPSRRWTVLVNQTAKAIATLDLRVPRCW